MNLDERVRFSEEQAQVTTPGAVAYLAREGLLDPAETRTCWFCRREPFDDESTNVQLFYRVISQEETGGPMLRATRTKYVSFALPIPRCRSCRGVHDRAESGLVSLVVVVVAAGAIAGWFAGGATLDFMIGQVLLAILGAVVGLVVGALINSRIAASRARGSGIVASSQDTDIMRRLRSQGITLGLRPPGETPS